MMLSPGRWHELVPKDLRQNLLFRKMVLEAALESDDFRHGILHICSQDILFFVNVFVCQFNPDLREKGPFISYDFQDAAIVGGTTIVGETPHFQHGILQCVEDREDCRWQKSRYVGASWLVLMTIVWLCLFQKNIKAFAISKDADAVDVLDDPDCLFWKVRHILEHLPDWMHSKSLKTKKGLIKFANGNILSGDANAASSGVGGRATVMLVDEFGQFDKNGEEIYSMTTDTCYSRIFVFTHKDQSGMAYRLCFDPKYASMREIVTHWSQHPERRRGLYKYDEERNNVTILDKSYIWPPDYRWVYDKKPLGGPCPGIRSPWYDKECRRREDRDIAMNLDIDPRGAGDRFFDTFRINVLITEYARQPKWVGNLSYDKMRGIPHELVDDPDGLIRLWVNPKSPTQLPVMRAGAGADIASGVGASPSCLCVFDATTGDKVLEYANAHIYVHDFAVFVVAMLRMIKDESGSNPMLIWEIQYAQAFDATIRKLMYRPFYVRREEDVTGRPRDNKGRAGENTSKQAVYKRMCDYRHGLYNLRCFNRSARALDECMNFVYTSTGEGVAYKARGKAKEDGSGAKIHHGDLVVADSLAYKVIQEMGYEGPIITEESKAPRPGSWEFREWLHEKRDAEREENEVWA